MTARLPRLLTLMGSGETSPTMVKVHREILDRLGPRPVPAVLLDTPFGFQENADELCVRVQHYFHESLTTEIANASGREPGANVEPFGDERLVTNVQRARYVFSGPGSPSYALRQWRGTVVPQLLAEKLEQGGAITFASAAALTLGLLTVPVYEVYKVGEEPRWLEGLDVVAHTGLRCAVIPHFNNAEGGTHDTRYCYLGERRLRVLEREMPDDTFVLGVDEHTSITFDLDARTATIGGIGVVTVRRQGRATTFAPGETVTVDDILAAAFGGGRSHPARTPDATPDVADRGEGLLLDAVREAEASFRAAVEAGEAANATAAMLGLEETIHRWSSDAAGQDEMPRARAALRSMIAEFGELADSGLEDPAARIAPFVEMLVELRTAARADRRFAEADHIRDELVALGLELQDTPDATRWSL